MNHLRAAARQISIAARARVPPRARPVLDLATIGLSLLALVSLADGGLRLHVAGLTLSMTSWVRLMIWAAAVALLRHWLWPRPSLRESIGALAERSGWPATFRTTLWSAGLGSRIAVLIIGAFAAASIGPTRDTLAVRTSRQRVSSLVQRGDVIPHLNVALSGYPRTLTVTEAHRPSFPAVPLLFRVGMLTTRPVLIGLLFVLAAFLWALVYVYRLARDGLDPDAALLAVSALAAYPFAVFFSVPSVDSLLLLGAAGAFYHLQRDEWLRAGAWGLLVGLTSPAGVFLTIPLLVLATSAVVRGGLRWRVSAACMPLLGFVAFMTYISVAGSQTLLASAGMFLTPTTSHVQSLITGPGRELLAGGLLPAIELAPLDVLDLCAVVLALVAVWPITRRFGAAHGVLVVAGLVPPLLLGIPGSAGRQTAWLFPIFLWIGSAVKPAHRWGWLACFAMLQAIVACIFFIGRDSF